MTANARVNLITQCMQVFEPEILEVIDESHLHEGHAEAKLSGGSHFNLRIVSTQFEHKNAVERHRMIYQALGKAMGTEIHALSIDAKTPTEATTQQKVQ